MTRRSHKPILALLFLAIATPAAAVDIVNDDRAAHDVVVVDSGETMRFRIAPRATLTDICSACRVELGQGAVDAEDGDTVTIREGRPVIGG